MHGAALARHAPLDSAWHGLAPIRSPLPRPSAPCAEMGGFRVRARAAAANRGIRDGAVERGSPRGTAGAAEGAGTPHPEPSAEGAAGPASDKENVAESQNAAAAAAAASEKAEPARVEPSPAASPGAEPDRGADEVDEEPGNEPGGDEESEAEDAQGRGRPASKEIALDLQRRVRQECALPGECLGADAGREMHAS